MSYKLEKGALSLSELDWAMETSEARGSHCLIFRCSGNTGFVVQTTAYSRTVIQDRRAFIDVLPCHATCLMGKIHNQASMRRVEKWKPQVTELVCFWHFIICPEGEYLPVEITKEWLFNVFGSGCLVDGTVELKRGTRFTLGTKPQAWNIVSTEELPPSSLE